MGKANFGFNAKYKKGTTVPTGKTSFKFNAAGFHFKSTEYEWLVIAGQKAKFKGTGTVNGQGNYAFMITGMDNYKRRGDQPDAFRIKIWDRNGGGVVYDNQMNVPDSEYNATVLGGGSIVIHSKGTAKELPQTLTDAGAPASLELFPNPATAEVNLRLSGFAGEMEVVLHDPLGRRILQRKLIANQPTDRINLASLNLAKGMYTVTVSTASQRTTERLVIGK